MSKAFHLHDQVVLPGKRATAMLPMPRLYDCAPFSLPVHIVHGKKPGPVLCLTAAIHGDEVNGVEIIRRILKKTFLKQLAGTLIAVPVVNMYGFLYQDRYLMDRRDLNRSFPGSENGSLAGRLAHLVSHEVISKGTHSIDLHTGSLHRSNLPQLRIDPDDAEALRLAKVFHAPVILHSKLREGSLREYASKNSMPSLVYEGGESLRFNELAIRTGVNGITNVMRELEMIPRLQQNQVLNLNKKNNKKLASELIAKNSYWVRAPHSGIIQPKKALGSAVKKGEPLAKIGNPTNTTENILYSPISGIIIGANNLPMVHAGAAVFHIATFEDVALVAENIENLQEHFDEGIAR